MMWVKAKVGKLGRELHRAPISLWGTLDATTLNNPTKPNTHSILGLINSILYINFPLKVVDMIYGATQTSSLKDSYECTIRIVSETIQQ